MIFMTKKILFLVLFSASQTLLAAKTVNLYQEPLSRLNQFSSLHAQNNGQISANLNFAELKPLTKTQLDKIEITRYQQFYKGLAIAGAQITISKAKANGHLFDEINLNTNPALSSDQALQAAKQGYFADKKPLQTQEEVSKLQIRADENNQLKLVYLVSFKGIAEDNKPIWPFFVIDAQDGQLLKQWSNIQNYQDTGPGGNEKVQEYWYGKDEFPSLDLTQDGESCTMDNQKVSLINLKSKWDFENKVPLQYRCGSNVEDPVNGSFSAGNDAYYFGQIIVNMYKNWYGMNALEDKNGKAQKLIMRVHFGENFVNAFWNGESMTFGDGDGEFFYPLVSLDVAGHEVSHGFTEQHADLEYHDESGALNESFSDMAGQASRAYLLETEPNFYNKVYLTPNKVTWGIGETILSDKFPYKALRFMDLPSLDDSSADCLDKKMARSHQSLCAISYPELVATAKLKYREDKDDRQSYIVHTASGIFNRAFYLLSKQIGIKEAFHLMIIANSKYWTPTTNFKEAACGVVYAARELKTDPNLIQSVFNKTGIEIKTCLPAKEA